MKTFFKKDKNGKPIIGSNKKTQTRPYGSWDVVVNFINGPIPNNLKVPFPGNKRYFFQMDANNEVMEGGLIESTSVPVGNYLELFANGIVTLPLGSNEDSGAVENDPEDIANTPMIISPEYKERGYRTTIKSKKVVII